MILVDIKTKRFDEYSHLCIAAGSVSNILQQNAYTMLLILYCS